MVTLMALASCEEDETNPSENPDETTITTESLAGHHSQYVSFCVGESLELKPYMTGDTYKWKPNGETTETIDVSTEGTYIALITNDSNIYADTITVTEINCDATVEVCGTIDENTTWTKDHMYLVTCNLSIVGATLTIEPGTIIKIKDDITISVGLWSEGTIIAKGNKGAPILFTSANTSPTAGDWNSFSFNKQSGNASIFEYCNFEYGGGYSDYSGIFEIEECKVAIDHCTITESSSYGIYLDDEAEFSSFNDNLISKTKNHAIRTYPNHVHTIGTGNDFQMESSIMGIEVKGGTFNLTEETWKAQNVPYIMNGYFHVASAAGSILNIEAGATLAFKDGADLEIGSSSENGTIIAIGTEDQPITFTAASLSPEPGDWRDIELTGGATNNCTFEYCVFEYGAWDGNYGMVNIEDCSISFDNCTINSSGSDGIWLRDAGFNSFTNNTFTNSDNSSYPINIEADYAHTLGYGNTVDKLGAKVRSGTISGNVTWKKLGFPYYVTDIVTVSSSTSPELTLEAGTIFKFSGYGTFSVGYGSEGGKLIAKGTAEDRITFTASGLTPKPSDWGTIKLYTSTMAGTEFDYCDVSYGGWDSNYGMITMWTTGTNVSISNSHFSHSGAYGIYVKDSNPTITNVTYSDNAQEDYYTR